MKIFKTISVLFLFAFAINIFGCGGGSDKDKVIKFYKNSMEFFKSDDFKKNMGDEAYMTKKQTEILKESGFENEKEFEEAAKKLENDPEIKALATEMGTVMENIMKEEMDKVKEEMDKAGEELDKAGEELEKAGDELDKTLEKDTDDGSVPGDEKETDDTK